MTSRFESMSLLKGIDPEVAKQKYEQALATLATAVEEISRLSGGAVFEYDIVSEGDAHVLVQKLVKFPKGLFPTRNYFNLYLGACIEYGRVYYELTGQTVSVISDARELPSDTNFLDVSGGAVIQKHGNKFSEGKTPDESAPLFKSICVITNPGLISNIIRQIVNTLGTQLQIGKNRMHMANTFEEAVEYTLSIPEYQKGERITSDGSDYES